MKILCSADWHLDAPMAKGDAALQKELLAIPGKLSELCREEGCDLVLLAGDLFDGPCSPESLNALRKALTEMAVPVFIAPGNHDHMAVGPWKTELFPENVHIFTEARLTSVFLPEQNATVWGAGYSSMDCPGLLEGFTADGTGVNIGILHGDPTIAASPNCPVTHLQVENSGLALLAMGHIHKGDSFTAGKTLCAWPGCPMGHGYDETGVKGALIITLEDTASARFVALDTPRFFDYETEAGDDPIAALDKLLPALGRDIYYYRITLTGPSQPLDLAALRARFDRIPNLTLRDRTTPPLDIWGNAGDDSFEGIYFGLLRQALDTAEDKETVLLAAKLSRQLLTGQEVALP